MAKNITVALKNQKQHMVTAKILLENLDTYETMFSKKKKYNQKKVKSLPEPYHPEITQTDVVSQSLFVLYLAYFIMIALRNSQLERIQ